MTTDVETVSDDAIEGLEDYDPNSATIPRIDIVQKEALFKDNLSGETFGEMNVILLGLIRQRVLWPPEVGEDSSGPMCRSNDAITGVPYIKEFPFDESGFDEADVDRDDPKLSCAGCALKDWGSHPTRDTPWCSEQHTYALLRETGEGMFTPALLSLQRSNLKPSNRYMQSFVQAKTPLFVSETKISLEARKRGNVDYSVAKFSKGEATDDGDHVSFAEQYRGIRDFLHTPRGGELEAIDGSGAKEITAPSTDPVEVTKNEAPAAEAGDDDLPF